MFTFDSAVVNVFYDQVVWAFLGSRSWVFCKFFGLSDAVQEASATPRGAPVVLAAWFCGFAIFFLIWTFWNRRMRSEQTLATAIFLLFAAFTARTALLGIPGGRYASLPGLATLLIILCSWNDNPNRILRAFAAMLLALALWSGLRDYGNFFKEVSPGQPAWSAEVQKWRTNESYAPAVWPSVWPPLDWKPPLSKRR
jgi:glycerol-3-phosphate acyltransferase PlsY